MAQCRTDGLCYNCDEKFVPGHRCQKLFVIEIVGFDDTEEPQETAAISGDLDTLGTSLHVLTGVQSCRFYTMKVFISLGNTMAVALLDSDSSHNFLDIKMAERAGLRLQPCTGLSVTVANGDRVPAPGKALAQTVLIEGGGEAFNIDLYALPL